MKYILHALLIILVSSNSFAGEKNTSLEDLGTILATNGLEAVIDHAGNCTYSSNGKKVIRISNLVKEQGTNKQLNPDWSYLIQAGPRTNLTISLPLRHHYVEDVAFQKYVKKHDCYNMASSGTKLYINENDTVISQSWSCGSGGCSFSFVFTEIGGRNLEKLCNDL